jgi:hypothetical protein
MFATLTPTIINKVEGELLSETVTVTIESELTDEEGAVYPTPTVTSVVPTGDAPPIDFTISGASFTLAGILEGVFDVSFHYLDSNHEKQMVRNSSKIPDDAYTLYKYSPPPVNVKDVYYQVNYTLEYPSGNPTIGTSGSVLLQIHATYNWQLGSLAFTNALAKTTLTKQAIASGRV